MPIHIAVLVMAVSPALGLELVPKAQSGTADRDELVRAITLRFGVPTDVIRPAVEGVDLAADISSRLLRCDVCVTAAPAT
jgi:hypothetical protein